jgi:hypothetical protein
MSRSVSVLLKDQPAVSEVESLVGERFEVTSWFPELHHWTVENDAAHIFLYYDTNYLSYYDQCESEERKAKIEVKLGAIPAFALHVQISSYCPGSKELAYSVIDTILRKWPGIVEDD